MITREEVLDALKPIVDPEIRLGIVDLGLIYDVIIEPLPESGDSAPAEGAAPEGSQEPASGPPPEASPAKAAEEAAPGAAAGAGTGPAASEGLEPSAGDSTDSATGGAAASQPRVPESSGEPASGPPPEASPAKAAEEAAPGAAAGTGTGERNHKPVRLEIRMTLTTPMCPYGPLLIQQVQDVAWSLPGVEEAQVTLVWDPPWDPRTMASDEVKDRLGIW